MILLVGLFVWVAGLVALCVQYGAVDVVNGLVRLVAIVPAGTVMAAVCVRLFDRITPGEWCYDVHNQEKGIGVQIGSAIVVGSIVLGVFWVAVQG